jgi:hypothetical protein
MTGRRATEAIKRYFLRRGCRDDLIGVLFVDRAMGGHSQSANRPPPVNERTVRTKMIDVMALTESTGVGLNQ